MLDSPSDINVTSTEKRVASSKFELDNRVSINTIIACLTIIGGVFAMTDRLSASAATTAVIQQKQLALETAMTAFITQRYTDRQEILSELKDIKSELREVNKVQRK